MKRKDGFMLRQFGDDYIVVAVGEGSEDFNRLITLNGVGEFIYGLLENDIELDAVVAAVVDKYDVSEQLARSDAESFIENLSKAGLIDA